MKTIPSYTVPHEQNNAGCNYWGDMYKSLLAQLIALGLGTFNCVSILFNQEMAQVLKWLCDTYYISLLGVGSYNQWAKFHSHNRRLYVSTAL